jgi:hypothetical protein
MCKIPEIVKDFKARLAPAQKAGSSRLMEAACSEGRNFLKEAVSRRQLSLQGASFKHLFLECFGAGEFAHAVATGSINWQQLSEAAGATSTATFANISGQIVYDMVLQQYQSPEFVATGLIPERQSNIKGMEKIAGITNLGDETSIVEEGKDYPLVGPSENWIYVVEPDKKGCIVPLTLEAILYDRTGQLVETAGKVGYMYGLQLEKAAIDCVIDENVTAHRYRWMEKGQIATYGDSSGTHNWDNLAASNALENYTDIEAAWLLLRNMTDPFTGEPILFPPTHLIVPHRLEWTARQLLTASTIRRTIPGFATSANPVQDEGAQNPVSSLGLNLVSTPFIEARQATKTSWYMGAIAKAFRRNVHLPMDVLQAPPQNSDEFDRDIAMKFKVRGKMGFATVEPRCVVKSTA